MYTDRVISCVDCGREFAFTTGEQEFYAQRGFTEPPKRCASCRAARKAQRNAGSAASIGGSASSPSSYDRASTSSYSGTNGYGSTGYASLPGYGMPERRPRQMYEAVCADCGKVAQLPFQPTGSRPVYCSDCFQGRRA